MRSVRFLLVAIPFGVNLCPAQGQTPYDSYVDVRAGSMLKLPQPTFKLYNVDTNALVRFVQVDPDALQLIYFSRSDSAIDTIQLSASSMKWPSTDPMASQRVGLSPYNFVQNSPISRLDLSGALDDDYRVDENGQVTLIRKTDDEFDRLYNSDESASVQVEKSFIQNAIIKAGVDDKGNEVTLAFTYSFNVDNTYDVFLFLADNTEVEIGYQVFSSQDPESLLPEFAVISTSYEQGRLSTASPAVRFVLESFESFELTAQWHSHPSSLIENPLVGMPSGYDMFGNPDYSYPSDVGDRANLEWLNREYPGRVPDHAYVYVRATDDEIIYFTNQWMRMVHIPTITIAPDK